MTAWSSAFARTDFVGNGAVPDKPRVGVLEYR
jgi:hypothetical protein